MKESSWEVFDSFLWSCRYLDYCYAAWLGIEPTTYHSLSLDTRLDDSSLDCDGTGAVIQSAAANDDPPHLIGTVTQHAHARIHHKYTVFLHSFKSGGQSSLIP